MSTHLAIKNMVCNRCIRVVRDELSALGIVPTDIRLGDVILEVQPGASQLEEIRSMLIRNGFELLDDKKRELIENAKIQIIDVIQHGDEQTLATIVFSQYLSKKLEVEYSHLSTLFSQLEGITLEKYVIMQRIERAKELMMYDELNFSEISYRLGYSSVHHLSNQFKKVTGMTPTEFKRLQEKPRKGLDVVAKKN